MKSRIKFVNALISLTILMFGMVTMTHSTAYGTACPAFDNKSDRPLWASLGGWGEIAGPCGNFPPDITLDAPQNNMLLSGTQSLTISGSVRDNDGSGNVLTINYQIDTGSAQTIQTFTPANSQNQSFSHAISSTNLSFLSEGQHTLKVTVNDNYGGSKSATRTFSIDRTPPTAPSLSLASKTESTASLSWTAAADSSGISQYEVYRGSTLVSAVGTNTAYTVSSLASGIAYDFSVKVKDLVGYETSSNTLHVVTADLIAPTVPTGLKAANITTSSFDLTWTASTDNSGVVASYDVFRNGVQIATVASASYSVTGITYAGISPTGAYSVKAKDVAGNISSSSEVLLVTTLPNSPEADDTAVGAYAISYGTTYAGYLSSATDKDFFRYTAATNGVDAVSLQVPGGSNYDVYIYDDHAKYVAASVQDIGESEEVIFKVTAGKTYSIKVVSAGSGISPDPYKLSVTRAMATKYKVEYNYDANGNLRSKTMVPLPY
ncbi:fibronectin type III domain-containing protein [Paenibacillus cymbidii]|uniref:fibronectin type III domain-containing protein n=1 Tax=Paenibacillus cymbidii TaxID=1639034 RepID=UPI001080EDE2|nr:fibronectin type III domain-containing protein [Paenibacillus cymbidii]